MHGESQRTQPESINVQSDFRSPVSLHDEVVRSLEFAAKISRPVSTYRNAAYKLLCSGSFVRPGFTTDDEARETYQALPDSGIRAGARINSFGNEHN